MKKLFFLLTISLISFSCKNIEKDSQAIADLKCVSYSSEDSTEIKSYEQNINDIKKRYSGSDLATLLKTSNSLYEKQCTKKIEDDKKLKELEEESKKFFEDYSTSLNEKIDVSDEDYENYSTPYNGLEKFEN